MGGGPSSTPRDSEIAERATVTHPGGRATPRSDDASEERDLVGRRLRQFHVTSRLGAGGMGVVYKAIDEKLDRPVALKVLASRYRAEDASRLLEEARSAAAVAHRNVATIHEVNESDDVSFIAMEYVDGETLRARLAAGPLPIDEVFRYAKEIAAGLACAHTTGIVHRDLKPDNAMVTTDGHIKLLDFGLARPQETSASEASRVAGTPDYMAPEQARGEPVDARSDVFAFGATLFELMNDKPPFERATTRPSEWQAPRDWTPRELPPRRGRRSSLARGLDAIVTRCLAYRAEDRFADGNELVKALDALEPPPRIQRRVWIAAGALAVLVTGALVMLWVRSSSDPCENVAPLEAWSAEARAATRNAFLATSLPFAAQAHDTVARSLDDYAARWRAMKVQTCRATHVDGTQSKELFERRNLCLDRRRDEVGAFVAALRVIPRERVEKAIDAMGNLGDLRACSDTEALSSAVPLPQDPARVERVRTLEREIASVTALNNIGRPEDRSAKVEELVASARALDYPPVLVTALGLKADVADHSDRWKDVVTIAQEQLVVAEASRDDRARLRIYARLLRVNSGKLQRHDEATQAGRLAEALLKRFGDDPELAAELHCAQCMAEFYRGNYEDSLKLAKLCAAERERLVPRNEGKIGDALQRQATVESSLKRYDEALVTSRRSVELLERAYGPRHPLVALALNIQGIIERDLGREDVGEALYRRAISIYEESRGETMELSSVLQNLGNLLQDQGKYAEAITVYRRILAILEKSLGPENNRVANTLDMLGKALSLSGNFEEGEAMGLRSIAIREANGSGNHPAQAIAWRILGGQYRRTKRYEKASEAFANSLRILEGKYGKSHPLLVTSLLGIAEAELHAGRPAVARAAIERALPHLDAPEVRKDRARLQFLHAQALWATPADRTRARGLADAALEAAGDDRELVSEIEAWRKTNAAR